LALCEKIVANHERRVVRSDGRFRYWGKAVIEGKARWIRVIVLEDGETVHNAFIDSGTARKRVKDRS
jgi:hypothetical protein